MTTSKQQDMGVAVVSGASGGIGSAVARRFVALGYRTILLGRNEQKLEALRGDLSRGAPGARVHACRMDISSPAELEEGMARLHALCDAVDVLVHSAGDGPVTGLLGSTEAQWETSLQGKLMGTVRLSRAVAERMVARKAGRIIVVNGIFALTPHPLFVINGTVNTALRGFAKALSMELGPHGVTVNTVHPGAVEGELWTQTLADLAARQGVPAEAVSQHITSSVPLGRITRADDLAGVVAFLASPAAAYVNGAVINVDGGACLAS